MGYGWQAQHDLLDARLLPLLLLLHCQGELPTTASTPRLEALGAARRRPFSWRGPTRPEQIMRESDGLTIPPS